MFSRQKVMPNCALKKTSQLVVVLQEIVQYCEDPAVLVSTTPVFVSLKYYSPKRMRNFGLEKGNFCLSEP